MSVTDNRVPVERIAIKKLSAPRGDAIPNNETYTALLLAGALGGETEPSAIHALYNENGWGGAWTWEVFTYHHFHPDAFEVLSVASGAATLMLGGPQGEEFDVMAGDVLILPPGYGHKQIEKREGFQICGGYPPGQDDYSTIRDSEGYNHGVLETMRNVAEPDIDPIYGLPFKEILSKGE